MPSFPTQRTLPTEGVVGSPPILLFCTDHTPCHCHAFCPEWVCTFPCPSAEDNDVSASLTSFSQSRSHGWTSEVLRKLEKVRKSPHPFPLGLLGHGSSTTYCPCSQMRSTHSVDRVFIQHAQSPGLHSWQGTPLDVVA